MKDGISSFFSPKGVAILGASSKPNKLSYGILENLTKYHYQGAVYPINPNADMILGCKCFKDVRDVPDPIELGVIVLPASMTVEAMQSCADKGIKAVIIISGGFREVGEEGKALEEACLKIAKDNDMRIIGPNCVGTMDMNSGLDTTFIKGMPEAGPIGFVSQSGAVCGGVVDLIIDKHIGFSHFASLGNELDVSEADVIEYFGGDPNVKVIAVYVEGIQDGKRFMKVAKKVSKIKPIVLLKAGRSDEGAKAVSSHTGSLAGAQKIYGAAFQQAGVIEATDLSDLFDSTLALSLEPPMRGDNLLVLTNGGGVGVLATDAAEKAGVPMKFAPEAVQKELKKHMPSFGSAKNPVDMTGMAGNEWYYDTTKFSFAHDWVDGLVVLYCETAMTNPMEIAKSIYNAVTETGITDKPITISFVGGERCDEAMQWLVENGIPAYNAPDLAVKAMGKLRHYARLQDMKSEPVEENHNADKESARKIIADVRANDRTALTEIESKKIFSAYGLPTVKTDIATSEDEAVEMAEATGYPIVMKIVSPDILHKSDAGGVKVNIKDQEAVRAAYHEILKNAKDYKADADIHGIVIQEMAPWGTETIIGSVNDTTFGATVMFGLGGIFVEVMKDVTFRVAPISEKEALNMLNEIRSAPILDGVRGETPRDKEALAYVLAQYAFMIYDLADEIKESDANPVLVYEVGEGVKIVDARIILKEK